MTQRRERTIRLYSPIRERLSQLRVDERVRTTRAKLQELLPLRISKKIQEIERIFGNSSFYRRSLTAVVDTRFR